MSGLIDQLDQDAAAGVLADGDPSPSQPGWRSFTSNWAAGEPNMPLAYLDWMYDDGPGSFNLDCPAAGAPGCWGHRHDVLWQFDGTGPLAMGAASGPDVAARPSYALLLAQQLGSSAPAYVYTWSQAVADGAGAVHGGPATGSTPGGSRSGASRGLGLRIRRVRVMGHRAAIALAGPLRSARCTLVGRTLRGRRIRRSRRCAALVRFARLPAGHYRVRVSSWAKTISRQLSVL